MLGTMNSCPISYIGSKNCTVKPSFNWLTLIHCHKITRYDSFGKEIAAVSGCVAMSVFGSLLLGSRRPTALIYCIKGSWSSSKSASVEIAGCGYKTRLQLIHFKPYVLIGKAVETPVVNKVM